MTDLHLIPHYPLIVFFADHHFAQVTMSFGAFSAQLRLCSSTAAKSVMNTRLCQTKTMSGAEASPLFLTDR